MDIKALRLMISALRQAERDYLDPKCDKESKASARTYLFGISESPLPRICEILGINVSAARLLLLQWKARGKVGDPVFSYLGDPANLFRAEHHIPVALPNFEKFYAGSNPSKKRRGAKNSK